MDFSKLNYDFSHSKETKKISSSAPNLSKTPHKHINTFMSASAPGFSMHDQVLMHNANIYEKSNASLVTAILGSKQPVAEIIPNISQQVKCNKFNRN